MFGRFNGLSDALLDDYWRLRHEVDELLGDGLSTSRGIRSLPRGSFPAINVVQTAEDVQIYLFAPGIDPKQLEVSIQQGLLTIAGQRRIPTDAKATQYRQERFSGQFHRAISLGDDVDAERVAATYRDGMVQIKVHRRASAKPRQIEIH
jgi:HSP20 family protein